MSLPNTPTHESSNHSANSRDSETADVISTSKSVFSSPTFRVVCGVAALCLLPQFAAGLKPLRILSSHKASGELLQEDGLLAAKDQRTGEAEITIETTERADLSQPETIQPTHRPNGNIATDDSWDNLAAIEEDTPPELLRYADTALDRFFTALLNIERKRGEPIARVSYFGDSVVASDYVTATLRRKLQNRFGDAGHGFTLIANAWPAYFHNDIFRWATSGWKVSRIVGPYTKDSHYGYGGVSFIGSKNVFAAWGTPEKGNFGRSITRFELAYTTQQTAGQFQLSVDKKLERDITIDVTEQPEDRFESLTLPAGEHRVDLGITQGSLRAFGVALENDGPGIVLDAIGIQGARIRFLGKNEDEHFKRQLKWRRPQLLVYQFGANESGDGFMVPMEEYYEGMIAVIKQAKAAVPDADCLIVGAMDRARQTENGMITVPVIPHIIREQERAAKQLGCAYWSTFDAMGGMGSMANWVKRGLGAADLTHPSGVGADRLGNWLYQALMLRYRDFREAEQKQIQAEEHRD